MHLSDEQLNAICDAWEKHFQGKRKPQRRRTSSLMKKLAARWKDSFFREHWQEALEISAQRTCLHTESWFNFRYFVHSADNLEKMLDDWMQWLDEKNAKDAANKATAELREAKSAFANDRDYQSVLTGWVTRGAAMQNSQPLIEKAATKYNPAFAKQLEKKIKEKQQ